MAVTGRIHRSELNTGKQNLGIIDGASRFGVKKAGVAQAESKSETGIEGDRREVVDYLFARYHRPLLRYITKMMPNLGEAEEVLQETYARIMCVEKLDNLEIRARAYIFTIASNIVRDRLRQKIARFSDKHLPLEDLELISEVPSPENLVEWNEALQIVKHCLLELKPRCRKIFLLRMVEQLTYKAIAEVMSVSAKTVERDMTLAVQLCRMRLRHLR